MMRQSLDTKVSKFIPFEAGRKVPIDERVAHYLKKLENDEQEEKDKQNPNRSALPATLRQQGTMKTIENSIIHEMADSDSYAMTDRDFAISEVTPRI